MSSLTYEPFIEAVANYVEGEHVQPLDIYTERLQTCDGCKYRTLRTCRVRRKCSGCPLTRMAARPTGNCPADKWER